MRQRQWEVLAHPAESHSPTVMADFIRRFHCCWHVQYDDLKKACSTEVCRGAGEPHQVRLQTYRRIISVFVLTCMKDSINVEI